MGENITPLGNHWIVELSGCDPRPISDSNRVQNIFLKAAEIAKANIIFYDFKPVKQGKDYGVSGGICISTSHFLTHTWPGRQYAAVDIYTCGETMNEEDAFGYIRDEFKVKPENMKLSKLERGLLEDGENVSGLFLTKDYEPDFKPGKKDLANRHYIIDMYRCDPEKISRLETAAPALLYAARQADPKLFAKKEVIINQAHNFTPSGMSALMVAPGADITIHTWPEHSYAGVDLFLPYDSMKGEKAIKSLQEAFGSKKVVAKEILRGSPDPDSHYNRR
jgi:S-adenosylmethionine decarboxylase